MRVDAAAVAGAPTRHPCVRATGARSGSRVARIAPRGSWPAWGAAIVFLGFVLGCGAPGADVPDEPASTTAADIPRIANLSGLDPGFATAVRDALSVVERDPSNGAAVGALGRLYQAHRYVDQARRCYERAEELDPSSPDWPYYLGFLAAGRGAHDEAARRFVRALELRPSYWAARVRLGNALLAAGDADGAEEAFRAVRAASPGTPWGELGLGKAARRRGQPEVAAEHLRGALALDAAHRETRYLLAMTERQLGNPERAGELLAGLENAEVSSLDDPMLEAVFALVRDIQTMIRTANQRLAEGEHLAAERLYREVLRLDPDSYDAHLNLGVLHGLADRNQEAAAALERAIEIDPDRADAYALLTIAYIKAGRAEEGLRQLEKALEIDPDHPRAREILNSLSGDQAPSG